ncbi:MAG: hypothetical protein KDA20_01720 [Phycisphaerales bacterium]|nr:hypothetical protein [Phycisphaerales bacterium]
MINVRQLVGSMLGVLVAQATAVGAVVYVDSTAGVGGDGSSWEAPYKFLDDAMAVAQAGDEVWCRAGSYGKCTLVSGVKVYGGFTGTETAAGERNPFANFTRMMASGPIVWAVDCDSTTLVDGFTITSGTAITSGANVRITGGAPVFRDCTITDGRAALGSGVVCLNGSPTFVDCNIDANFGLDGGTGTGIYASGSGTLTLIRTSVSFNAAYQAEFNANSGHGAGLYTDNTVVVMAEDCVFDLNYCFYNNNDGYPQMGGGVRLGPGGGFFDRCYFARNFASYGGAICSYGPLDVVNSVFEGNRAADYGCVAPICPSGPIMDPGRGGAIATFNAGTANIVGCTIAANWAGKLAGAVNITGTISDSILWSNKTAPVCCGEDPPPPQRIAADGNIVWSHCAVQEILTPEPGQDPIDPALYPGCFQDDPLFVTNGVVSNLGQLTTYGDYHLQAGSLAIDAADNALAGGLQYDFEGMTRFVDDPATVDTGVGPGPIMDMGAFEVQAPAGCAGDANGDLIVDLGDLSVVLFNFGTSVAPGTSGDIDGSGIVDLADLSIVLFNFGLIC